MELNQVNRNINRFVTAGIRERIAGTERVQTTTPAKCAADDLVIFKVVSRGGCGDGVYNCYKQKLLNAEWADYFGDAKFADNATVSVEVLNLFEYDPEAEYTPSLSTGEMMAAWQIYDDKKRLRWAGIPLKAVTGGSGITWAIITQSIAYGTKDAAHTTYKGNITGVSLTGIVQSPFASNCIKLDSSASSEDDFYTGYGVMLTSGTGAGQTMRTITAYVSAEKTAIISPVWVTTPDATTHYALFNQVEIRLCGTESLWTGSPPSYNSIDPREWIPWFCVPDIVPIAMQSDGYYHFTEKLLWTGPLGTGSLSWNETDKRAMAVAKGTV